MKVCTGVLRASEKKAQDIIFDVPMEMIKRPVISITSQIYQMDHANEAPGKG